MFQVATILYSFFYTIGLLIYGPVRILKAAWRGQRIEVLSRLGKLPEFPPKNDGCPTVWLHAVSVGEVNAARSLIKRLGQMGYAVYLSTTTPTGQVHARNLFGQSAQVIYFPFDWKMVCRKFLNRIRPDIVVLIETEIWPNFILSTKDLNIPLILVNGRISDRSARRYVRLRFLIRPLLDSVSHFCMQSQRDLERILRMGASRERISCTGNLKFDYDAATSPEQDVLRQSISGALKRAEGDLLLICGSTKPGEEELLLSAFGNLRPEFPQLRLLVAPRHPHRGDEVAALVRSQGFRCLQRSKNELETDRESPVDVLVLDSIGELAAIYPLGDIVFIGGSLVPTGGQNVIEAAACGKAILFGPHMENFRQVASAFVEAGAAIQLPSPVFLEEQLRALITDTAQRFRLGQKALEVVENNRGALEQTIKVIEGNLPKEYKAT